MGSWGSRSGTSCASWGHGEAAAVAHARVFWMHRYDGGHGCPWTHSGYCEPCRPPPELTAQAGKAACQAQWPDAATGPTPRRSSWSCMHARCSALEAVTTPHHSHTCISASQLHPVSGPPCAYLKPHLTGGSAGRCYVSLGYYSTQSPAPLSTSFWYQLS